ncbi:MAG: hypothetical protein EAZ44_10010 [Cytophagia bacterium]|nr:MAG: hypothetical protein EAZ44_10010 [Cytophagia bacterium]TAG44795.1 MAG: hypothetical protein EAZ31_01715 [Cytophagia bacterium]
MSNNIPAGTKFNHSNMFDNQIFFRVPFKDTLYIGGKQKDGRLWAEKAYPKIIIGYLNVQLNQKEYYESILNSIKCDCED